MSAAVGDSIPPVLELLHEVDPTFRDVPHIADGRASTQFASNTGYKVEFLTRNYGKAEYGDTPARMPALGGAAAQPLRFLDFLIHEPVKSVLLHKSGVPVTVPAPERFAVHKVIVAARRLRDAAGYAKSSKDLHQAAALAGALAVSRRHADLALAWTEAWERGPTWREALETGVSYMQPEHRDVLQETLEAGLEEIDVDPAEFGLTSRPSASPPRM
nr:GSU2403 family nucleotidyltransferase fold protein [Methylobacterium sp. Leaf123]